MAIFALHSLMVAIGGLAAALVAVGYVVRKVLERRWGWVHDRHSLEGRVFVVTGANTGLGYETARHLVGRRATVVMACRSERRATEAIKRIRVETPTDGKLVYMHLDLCDGASVRTFVRQLLSAYPHLDCVVNNAGVAHDGGRTNAAGIELTFAVNQLGPFLLMRLLMPAFRRSRTRIVIVSSTQHQTGRLEFDRLGTVRTGDAAHRERGLNADYCDSKLANFYMARELYRRGYDVHVLCPGLCYTDIFRHWRPAWYAYALIAAVAAIAMRSAEHGAQCVVHCATTARNTNEENPATGYFVKNLRPIRSRYAFSNADGDRLWRDCERMCGVDGALE